VGPVPTAVSQDQKKNLGKERKGLSVAPSMVFGVIRHGRVAVIIALLVHPVVYGAMR
jgi:hypothetical protein